MAHLTEKKLQPVLKKAFNHFDKDRSGFIESGEIQAAVSHVLTLAHLPQVPSSLITGAWSKVAGADGRIDLPEFTRLVQGLFHRIKGDPHAVAAAAQEAGYQPPAGI